MSVSSIAVLVLAASAIVWVNWYFFLAEAAAARRSARLAPIAAPTPGGAVREVTITVDGGYAPKTVHVRAGEPVRLVFDRKDSGSCSEEIVIPAFNIRKFLPTGQRTPIELTPAAGTYPFQCGMGMLHGSLVADVGQA